MEVTIQKENFEKVLIQGENEFPIECCGLLGGKKEGTRFYIQAVYPLYNVDQSREHFSMDLREQLSVVKNMRRLGLELLGNYHSHPYTPSRPSEEDKKLAYDERLIYGILSLEKKVPVLKFFLIERQREVQELSLTVI